MSHDLVIRGGLIADGLGGEPIPGDVAVDDGIITHVGSVTSRGTEEIDATDQLVTPGFVDIHTHYDGQVTWDSSLAPSTWHGVTTAVMGNCGVGFAPVHPEAHRALIELMEGVEDIPGAVLDEGISWEWESFGDYLDAVARRPHEIDIGAQLPHGALRHYVMGERAVRLEEATEEDMATMRSLAADAMRAGALGFTTSRTLNHRTSTGDPTPSLRATSRELEMIALGLADAGHGVIELISDFSPDLAGELELIRQITLTSGRPISVSLAQNNQHPEAWRSILDKLGEFVADGLPVKAQVAPRPVGLLLGLQSSFNPFSLYPAYQSIAKESLAEQVRTLRVPSFRQRLLNESPTRELRIFDYSRMFALGQVPNYEPTRDTSIEAEATRRGIDVAEVALDLLLEDDGRNFLFAPFSNYANFNLDCCQEMMASEHTLFGLGDGGAHVGIISDASFPTFTLTHWGRDRPQGRFPIGWLVQQLTSTNARAVGLEDRGVIAPGLRADLNVIDFARLQCERPTMAYDLPAGGTRLLQRARGYTATIVRGQVINRDGVSTGAQPGHLIRGPQADPR
ncbi:MAG TPA: amidohydrolase family protein [Acidimicrobiales bacterium]